jgi:hypothetical protein
LKKSTQYSSAVFVVYQYSGSFFRHAKYTSSATFSIEGTYFKDTCGSLTVESGFRDKGMQILFYAEEVQESVT